MGEKDFRIQRLEAVVPLDEYVKTCVDVPKFLAFCAACPNYEKRWSCPPFVFDPMDIWKRFDRLRLVASVLFPAPGASVEEAVQALAAEKTLLMHELLAAEIAYPGSLSLSAGSCYLCEECTKGNGTPCCRPEEMRYSIEALGGDVGKSAERYLGKPLLWIKDGVLPEYLSLVAGLLLKEQG